MIKDTGGPAFPCEVLGIDGHGEYGEYRMPLQGMTLRDYFAAKAMQAEFAIDMHLDDMNYCAKRAYAMADAMLKARTA
jgi:hypothetical protein